MIVLLNLRCNLQLSCGSPGSVGLSVGAFRVGATAPKAQKVHCMRAQTYSRSGSQLMAGGRHVIAQRCHWQQLVFVHIHGIPPHPQAAVHLLVAVGAAKSSLQAAEVSRSLQHRIRGAQPRLEAAAQAALPAACGYQGPASQGCRRAAAI